MKHFENEYATIIIRDDGILQIIYEDKLLSKEEVSYVFKAQRQHSPWEISPILAMGKSFSNLDNDARQYLSSEEVMKHCSALAIIAKSLGEKIAANFFITFSKPARPTKFFSNEEDAIKWLLNFQTISKTH